MAQQWKVSLSPGSAIDDMARLASQYEEMVSGYDQTLHSLQESLQQVSDERVRAVQRLEEVRDVLNTLSTAMSRAEQLAAAGLPEPRGRLQSVPQQDSRPSDLANPPRLPVLRDAPSPVNHSAVILSPKVKELLALMCSRPAERWTSMDIAALQGLAETDRLGRKRLRNTLRDAVAKGFLERITHDGDRRVYYRVLMSGSPA